MRTVEITLSQQSVELLDKLALLGIYGVDRAEIAARFIDEALQGFVQPPRFDGAGWVRKIEEASGKQDDRFAAGSGTEGVHLECP